MEEQAVEEVICSLHFPLHFYASLQTREKVKRLSFTCYRDATIQPQPPSTF